VGLSILNITFDCVDSDSVSHFWSEVTGWPRSKVEMPGNPFWEVAGPTPDAAKLVFVEVAEPKRMKNRVHLDLIPRAASQDQELDRVLSLGARIIDDRRRADPGGWVVLVDPEGNEFDIEIGP
jgi:predicted enzyme related to lactoylglutathione lyase